MPSKLSLCSEKRSCGYTVRVDRCTLGVSEFMTFPWTFEQDVADRLIPGEGEIPLDRFVAAIRRTGYSRPWVIELFSDESLEDSLWKGDLERLVATSASAFASMWGRSAA